MLKLFRGGADDVGMANTGKHTPPRTSSERAIVATGPTGGVGERLSPRVEMLRKLVAAGQYQVSPRYLAYRIFESAGVRPE